jgi:hypothetical protein
VEFEEGIILLKPLKFYETDLQKIRLKVKSLGIDDKSVAEAVKWARSK